MLKHNLELNKAYKKGGIYSKEFTEKLSEWVAKQIKKCDCRELEEFVDLISKEAPKAEK